MTTFTEHRRYALATHLRKHIAGEVRFDDTSRQLYSTDASIYQMEPLGVVIPRTVQDVVATVQTAAEMRVPITARGGGTSLSGQSIGPGVVLDCSKYLNSILDLDPVSRVVARPAGRRARHAQSAPGRARPSVRPGRGHRQPGQPRRHDRQQLGRARGPSSTARRSITCAASASFSPMAGAPSSAR